MDSKIFYGIVFLLIISTGTVFAQESLITVLTEDNNYVEGDIVIISGRVTTKIENTPITLQIIYQGSIIEIAQIVVAQDGSYTHTIIAEGSQWQNKGEYTVRASYGEENVVETEFTYTPESKLTTTTANFEVDAGSQGTFDVGYTIRGGNVTDMTVDSNIFALIIQIEPTDEGAITLDLPREFIGAEKQDGKDDIFIILIDEINVPYQESVVHEDSRTITINFQEKDSTIKIIGTYVVPEFGTIAMIILMAGIMTAILASRNKFQIKI